MSDAVRAREKTGDKERCPYCHEQFSAAKGGDADERVTCAGCSTPHHAECFAENGGCSSLGCERAVAKVQGGGEVPVGLLAEGVRPGSRSGSPLAILYLLAPLLALAGLAAGSPTLLAAGVILVGIAFGLWLLGRGTEMLPLDDRRLERPAPYLNPIERAPVHGVEILNAVVNRPPAPTIRPEDFREPSGETRPCPACSRPLEDASELRFCYHCGAALR